MHGLKKGNGQKPIFDPSSCLNWFLPNLTSARIVLEIFSIVPLLTMLEVVTKKSNYGIIIWWNVVKASIL